MRPSGWCWRWLLRPDRVVGVKGTASRRRTASAGPDGLPIDTAGPGLVTTHSAAARSLLGHSPGAGWNLLRGGAPDRAKRAVIVSARNRTVAWRVNRRHGA